MAQPAGLTFSDIHVHRVGDGRSYLLIGTFPRLMVSSPSQVRDGDIQATHGVPAHRAVIFLFNSVGHKWTISTLILLLGIGMGCWWLGGLH